MMRGNAFHNLIAAEARQIFARDGWHTSLEYRYRSNNTTTYFDLFATKGRSRLACEIETTPRHALDNVVKANIVNVPVWIIVPSRRVQEKIENKLLRHNIVAGRPPVEVLLLGQLMKKLAERRANNSDEE